MKRRERAVAAQFNRPKGGGRGPAPARASASSRRQAAAPRRPWAAPAQFEELSREQREIVLGRVASEVAAPLAKQPALRPLVACGANAVARALASGELGVVVLAGNPDSPLGGHLPLACRLRGVPVCLLHASSRALGQPFGLKSLAAFGIRDPARCGAAAGRQEAAGDQGDEDHQRGKEEVPGGDEDVRKQAALSPEQRARLVSIMQFLQSKASRKA